MRTILDIDDDVLRAVQERAKAENKTAGQVLSELLRSELMAGGVTIKDGIPILPSRGGVVTREMIDEIQEEIDLEDMRRASGQKSSDQQCDRHCAISSSSIVLTTTSPRSICRRDSSNLARFAGLRSRY